MFHNIIFRYKNKNSKTKCGAWIVLYSMQVCFFHSPFFFASSDENCKCRIMEIAYFGELEILSILIVSSKVCNHSWGSMNNQLFWQIIIPIPISQPVFPAYSHSNTNGLLVSKHNISFLAVALYNTSVVILFAHLFACFCTLRLLRLCSALNTNSVCSTHAINTLQIVAELFAQTNTHTHTLEETY